ncbi:MAG: hypothetical protein P8Z40_01910 [Chloroflexota bacterium]
MDIPIGVDEACSTQVCGRSTYLVIIRLRCMPRELVEMDNLKLDKKAVARLPAIFVHRKWK